MKSKTLKGAIPLLMVLGALSFFRLALPSAMTVSDEVSPFFKSFPLQIGNWQGEEMVPDERDLQILETRNVLSRMYRSKSGDSLHLFLVSSKKDRRVAHPPEVCYISSNFNVVNARESVVVGPDSREIPVKEFTAVPERRPDSPEEVLYLYKIGNRFTTNYYAQQLQFAMDNLSKNNSEVLMIRLAGRNKAVLEEFLKELIPVLN